jgi:HprK-related kinase B
MTIASLAGELSQRFPATQELWLDIGGLALLVRSNSAALLGVLSAYFDELVIRRAPHHDLRITAIEADLPRFPLMFCDWPRERGKSGQKERHADLPDGRVVLKNRTGMQFLLSRNELVAVGRCHANSNQVVNFIISQYLGKRLGEGWALCHAAAVALDGRGIAIAARAGAGKSTLALQLISTGLSFVSNDRLLIRRRGQVREIAGAPKMPRVNPGTLLHNQDLCRILPPERRSVLTRLDPSELWHLEEKYDVMVRDVYGPGRCIYRAPLCALLVLNWAREASGPARFDRVQLAERLDLLEQVMKSPGVFHQNADGRVALATARPDPAAYVQALSDVVVYEATGRVDFDVGVGICRRLLER